MPTRSTTSNQRPCPTSLSALIKNVSAPCVTAVDKLATLACGRRCPVLSKKLYTATLTGLPAAGAGIVSNSFFTLTRWVVTVGSVSVNPVVCITAQPLNKDKIDKASIVFFMF